MSGDNTPECLVRGSVKASQELDVDIILVGGANEREAFYKAYPGLPGVSFVVSASVLTMKDAPGTVMKEKADSSMAVAMQLLKEGKVDALVSPGNTGALFTASSLMIRRIKGIRRAALGSVLPLDNPFIMLDVGANTDATPDILQSFAHMGSHYMTGVLGIENPRVALLNNGTEETKGIDLYRDTYQLLKNDKNINFIGNREGRDLPANCCDVVVCDGFTGNIALKSIEGMGAFMNRSIKGLFYNNLLSKMSAVMVKKHIVEMRRKMDHREYGGAPFLGIAKPVVKSHGNSDEKAIYSSIRQAKLYHESGVTELIENSMNKEITDNKD